MLKSFRLRDKLKKKKKKKGNAGRIIAGATTALIGIGFLSATADAVRRV